MSKLPAPADRVRAKNDGQAIGRFRTVLDQSLATVTKEQWRQLPRPNDDSYLFVVEATLRTRSDEKLVLRSTLNFGIVDDQRPGRIGERKVETREYAHTIGHGDTSNEVVSWHWHPGTVAIPFPHLHVGRGGNWAKHPAFEIPKLHVPTSRVAFEEILLFAVHDLDVEPVGDRDIQIGKLRDCLETFKQYRTWV